MATAVAEDPAGISDGTKGIFGGGKAFNGSAHPTTNIIQYVTMDTTGNALDFGDLTVARNRPGACNSDTRGLFGGGGGPASDVIDYITMASTGNATDFGNLAAAKYGTAGVSNTTRAVFGGGQDSTYSTVIDYVTIDTTGNAADFYGDTDDDE